MKHPFLFFFFQHEQARMLISNFSLLWEDGYNSHQSAECSSHPLFSGIAYNSLLGSRGIYLFLAIKTSQLAHFALKRSVLLSETKTHTKKKGRGEETEVEQAQRCMLPPLDSTLETLQL